MLFHLLKLFLCKFPRLVQDAFRDSDLSDIVKGGSRRDQKAVVPGQIVEIGFADQLLQKELRHHIDVKHMGTALAVTKLHNLA